MYASLNDSVRAIDVASQPMPLRTPLKERLVAWAQAPGGRGEVEGELELGGMLQINMESCANVWPSHSSEYVSSLPPPFLFAFADVIRAKLTKTYKTAS